MTIGRRRGKYLMGEMFTLMANFHRQKMSPTWNFSEDSIRAKLVRRSPRECGFETMNTDLMRLERRAAQRFAVHLPVSVHSNGLTVPGFTQDLSARGILFYAETNIPEGAALELTFIMPSEITLGESMPVRGRGRVLRSVAMKGSRRNGIAVRLEAYEHLPEKQPILQCVQVSTPNEVTPARTIAR